MIQPDRTRRPPIRTLDKMELTPPQQLRLPNGVPLYLINSGEAEVPRIDLVFRGGLWHQNKPLQANLTGRMLREGTRKFTAGQLAERLDYYGALLDTSCSPEHTFVTLYTLNKFLPDTMELLSSMVLEPTFPQDELETMVEKELNHFRVISRQASHLSVNALRLHLFGEAHPLGYQLKEEDYHRIQAEDLIHFHQHHYGSSCCSIYLSGRIKEETIRCLTNHLGAIPFGRAVQPDALPHFTICTSPQQHIFIEKSDLPSSCICLGQFTLERSHPDFLDLRMLVTMLGGYYGSRLMRNIREEQGLCYSIMAGLMNYPGCSILVYNTLTMPDCTRRVIDAIGHEVQRLQTDLADEAEMTMLRNYALGELCRSYDSVFALADAWINLHTSGYDSRYLDATWESIHGITAERIRELAQRYLCKENLKEVVVGQKNVTKSSV